MEMIIKFILGVTVIAFVISFLATIGYTTFKVRNVIYKKYGVNILRGLYYVGDILSYSDYILTGIYSIWIMLFMLGLSYLVCQLGNLIYSFIQ